VSSITSFAADTLNTRVLPFFEEQDLPMLRILTDRGTAYCGKAEQHDYGLYLTLNDIEHTKTRTASPQTNGICDALSQSHPAGILPSGVSQAALHGHSDVATRP
jgi:hypothetical protein